MFGLVANSGTLYAVLVCCIGHSAHFIPMIWRKDTQLRCVWSYRVASEYLDGEGEGSDELILGEVMHGVDDGGVEISVSLLGWGLGVLG